MSCLKGLVSEHTAARYAARNEQRNAEYARKLGLCAVLEAHGDV